MWNRPIIPLLSSADVPWRAAAPGGLGDLHRRLSCDADTGAETSLVRIEQPRAGVLRSGADVFVIRGSGMLNGQRVGPQVYVDVPAGARLELEPDMGGLLLVCGFFGAPTLDPLADGDRAGEVARVVDTEALAWEAPASAPRPGSFSKRLRSDARGVCFLSAMLPGYATEREEWHPQAEEGFRLSGELMLGRVGLAGPGTYSFRPPGYRHGPVYSRGGTLAFIRCQAEITTAYGDPTHDRRARAAVAYAHHAPAEL